MQLVLRVIDSDYAVIKTNPDKIYIHGVGETNTLGWQNGALIPWVYVAPPTDGLQDYDFYGEPPSGISLPALGILNGSHIMVMPLWMKGYRIHTAEIEPYVKLFSSENEIRTGDPRQQDFYLEAGNGSSGFAGSSYAGNLVTKTDLFSAKRDLQGPDHVKQLRKIIGAEQTALFDPAVLATLLNTQRYDYPGGFHQYLTIKDGNKSNSILWTSPNGLPNELLHLHMYLAMLS